MKETGKLVAACLCFHAGPCSLFFLAALCSLGDPSSQPGIEPEPSAVKASVESQPLDHQGGPDAGPEVRFLAVIPIPCLMCQRRVANIPAARTVDAHMPGPCSFICNYCIGSSLDNCSLQMGGWIGIAQGAIITYWNNK